MPLLILLLGLVAPRVSIVLLWLFTSWFTGVFDRVLWLVLGLLLLPVSALWFSVVVNVFGGQWSILPVIGMVIAVLVDIGVIGSSRR